MIKVITVGQFEKIYIINKKKQAKLIIMSLSSISK